METENNPFIVTGNIEPKYFCDRVKESERLIKSITNGNNMVIMSPRRMGKTGLIRYCYAKKIISDNYYTFFVDILHTTSLKEFTYTLGKEIYETLIPRSKKMTNLLIQTLKSINGHFGFDPVSNTPTFNVQLGDIDKPEYTLEEIFSCLSSADKPCIVAIDEFQQIAKYSEKNIEAMLRGHIQKMNNCHFILAGSERHILQEMFVSTSRPFYRSSDIMELNAIARNIYVDFIVGHFKKKNRSISPDDVNVVYDMFKGHTFYIQKVFNESFSNTPKGGKCSIETIMTSINDLIEYNDTTFREILSNIPEKQKELLYAIAIDGETKQITSSSFIKSHKLDSASSVQSAIKKLLSKDLITEINKIYSINDKLLALWIRKNFGGNLMT